MTFIYLILVLGLIIFIHELGHFIFAKKAGIYVYEFALGMGPRLFRFRRKNDETIYSIRAFPIGGYVQMAGESIEADRDIPQEKTIQAKSWSERFMTIIAGVLFNFILAIILLFFLGLFTGAEPNKPVVANMDDKYPAYQAGLRNGDEIVAIDNHHIYSIDHLLLELEIRRSKPIVLTVKSTNVTSHDIEITPTTDTNGNYVYGISLDWTTSHGFIASIKYAFTKTINLLHQTALIIYFLITGKLGLGAVSGPIGMYTIVDTASKAGFSTVIYLMALISVNIAFINLLPFPAFDGGRVVFLIIEKIKGKPVDPKIENTIHTVGFILLMLLTLVVAYNDIIKLMK